MLNRALTGVGAAISMEVAKSETEKLSRFSGKHQSYIKNKCNRIKRMSPLIKSPLASITLKLRSCQTMSDTNEQTQGRANPPARYSKLPFARLCVIQILNDQKTNQ